MNRRALLATVPGNLLVGGCLGQSKTGGESTSSKKASKKASEKASRTGGNLTDWEPSVKCNEERNSMYVSDIRVEEVRSSTDGNDVVVHFSDLSRGEKDILRTVTKDGGYDTCDVSDAFDRFRKRMGEHAEGLDRMNDEHVYLERDGVYYLVEIMVTDQGFVY